MTPRRGGQCVVGTYIEPTWPRTVLRLCVHLKIPQIAPIHTSLSTSLHKSKVQHYHTPRSVKGDRAMQNIQPLRSHGGAGAVNATLLSGAEGRQAPPRHFLYKPCEGSVMEWRSQG